MFTQLPNNSSPPGRNSSIPVMPRTGIPLQASRRRGGQPGNSNAFRHGLYAAHPLHTQTVLLESHPGQKEPSILIEELQDRVIISGKEELRAYRGQLACLAAISNTSQSFKEIISHLRSITLIVGKMLRISSVLLKLEGRRSFFSSLVRDLPALLRWEFSEMGIPIPPLFVPRKLVNVHANLNWEAPGITNAQWELLSEILVSQRTDMEYFRKYRRRIPLPSDRFLLEGILWKLANGLHWRDLAGKYPVRRCQELYAALVRSGRMQNVYNRLWGHLDLNGGSTLAALVESGCFVVSGNRILLATSEKPTWEKYTALLLLQRGNHARRSIRLGMDRERRRLGRFYRYPCNQSFGSRVSSKSKFFKIISSRGTRLARLGKAKHSAICNIPE